MECGSTESGLFPAHTPNYPQLLLFSIKHGLMRWCDVRDLNTASESYNMSKKNRIQMPQSTAGLVRYFDESKERIKFKPEHIAAVCVVLIVIEILLKLGFF
jgi:preprotein translocase subunit Sec61beta